MEAEPCQSARARQSFFFAAPSRAAFFRSVFLVSHYGRRHVVKVQPYSIGHWPTSTTCRFALLEIFGIFRPLASCRFGVVLASQAA